MSHLVSIILPTYNVENYLAECIESVCAQTYRNIEIIIVIDGATDRSFDIAKEYETKDSRIIVLYQENAGSGPARNNGLNHANGKYVMFVDPDDWIDSNMVEKFVCIMEDTGVDLLTSRAINVFYNLQGVEIAREKNKCEERLLDTVKEVHENYYKLYTEHLLGAPTKKMYRMDIIREYAISFPDLRRSQDIVFNYQYYRYVKKVYVSDLNLYYYRINKMTNVFKLPKDYYKTVLLIHNGILDMYRYWGESPTDKEIVGYNNIFLDRIERCLEAKIVKKESLIEILEFNDVLNIIRSARPQRVDKKILKYFVLKKSQIGIKFVVRIKRCIRKVRG